MACPPAYALLEVKRQDAPLPSLFCFVMMFYRADPVVAIVGGGYPDSQSVHQLAPRFGNLSFALFDLAFQRFLPDSVARVTA